MTLSRHHVVALIGATLTSAIALSGAVINGTTGVEQPLNLGLGWMLAIMLVHGFTYAALSWVLIRERALLERANRFARAVHGVLLASLGVLAIGFVLVAPVMEITKTPPTGPVGIAWEWIASIGFAGMIISSLLLGVAVLRNNPLGYGGRLLLMLVPVLGVTVLLGFIDSDWAHPGYVETVIHFGVALIGVRAAAGTTTEPAPSVDAEPDNHRVLDPS